MRPNDALVRHYLANSLVMRLATVSGRGAPSLTPIWFVAVDGHLVSSTGATTVAARNIGAEPRVTVLLDGEAAGRLPPLGVVARFGLKYYLSRGGLRGELSHANKWRLRTRYYAQSDAVWPTIEPTAAELMPLPRP